MTGFIANTARGENPVGSSVVRHPLRGRSAAVPDHAGHQCRQHRARSTLPAGVLMSLASPAASPAAATASIVTGKNRDRDLKSVLFLSVLWFSLFFGVMVLVVLIVNTALDGSSRFDADLITAYDSSLRPETTGFRAGILGSVWLMVFTAALAVPLGMLRRCTWRSLRTTSAGTTRLDRGLPAEPGRRAFDCLRHAGRWCHGPVGLHQQRRGARWRCCPCLADPPGHHHHHARSRPRRPAGDQAGVARSRRHGVADDLAADAALRCPGHCDRHHPGSVSSHR